MKIETVPFPHEGEEFEIRITSDESKTEIQVFSGEEPANGYTYSINHDLKRELNSNSLKDLVEIAKNDVINKNWERLLEAHKEIKK